MKIKEFFSLKNVFTTRSIVFMGLMVAVTAVLSPMEVYLSPDLKLNDLEFLPGALVAIMYGPWAALIMGFVADFVGFVVNPVGFYFPGFAISAMVSNLIFALFFYKQKLNLPKVIIARLITVLIVSFYLNLIWLSMMGLAPAVGTYYSWGRVISRLIQFPFDITLIMLIGRLIKKNNKIF